jgi:chaperonin GroES
VRAGADEPSRCGQTAEAVALHVQAQAGIGRRHCTMKIRPLHDRVLVKRLEEETKTSGGLFIPDSAKEKPIQAKVIAVGAGKRDKDGKIVALEVKAGDRVLFSKYSGTEVKIDGEEHLIMREEDLLAVLD